MGTATQANVTLDTYLHSTYVPDGEFIDGVVEERPMGGFDHASWQEAILAWFRLHAEQRNIRARPELRVQVAVARYRVPDVVVLDRALPIEQIVTRAPLAVVEILPPEDTTQRALHKPADYDAMGIGRIWGIDPTEPAFYRYAPARLERMSAFGAQGDRIHFPMAEIAKLLD